MLFRNEIAVDKKEKERERKKERVEKQYYGKRFQVTSLQARSRQEGTAQLLF